MLADRYCLCGDWHHEAGFRAESGSGFALVFTMQNGFVVFSIP